MDQTAATYSSSPKAPQKPTFEQYIQLTEDDQKEKVLLYPFFNQHGFYTTLYLLDRYFERYASNPRNLYYYFYIHCKCLYSLVEDKLESKLDNGDQNEIAQIQIDLERMQQMIQFMYRAVVECESTSETLKKLRIAQNIEPFESEEETLNFVFENAPYFDVERNKFKQVLLDTIQHYTVVHKSKNYRFDFEILIGFYRAVFELHNYIAPARSDPLKAAQDSLGETDLYAELLEESGLGLSNQ
ncbi:hypothetical protein ABK040_016215 [Willaertia magna]